MNTEQVKLKWRPTCAWALFAGGIMMILILQLVRINIVYTYWGWNKSYFAQHWFWPLLVLAFVISMLSPLFGAASFLIRLGRCLAALFIALLVYGGSSLIILLLYGA